MTDTINNKIPFVPENTIDPAAGLNLSLNTIDALLQVLVQTVGANTPPAGVEGQRFIVGTAPTGAWAGQANKLARFLNGAWQFFDARHVLNAADGALYVRSGSVWTLFSPPIADNSVTNAKLADVATQTIKGRTTAGTGDPEDLTAAQARAVLALGSAATRDALGTTGSLYSRDSILGTVSQSAGVPTGAIIERGSNANGSYTRWADGTQICWLARQTNTAWSQRGAVFEVLSIPWQYPAAFAEIRNVSFMSVSNQAHWGSSSNFTGSMAAPTYYSVTAGSQLNHELLRAEGFWY